MRIKDFGIWMTVGADLFEHEYPTDDLLRNDVLPILSQRASVRRWIGEPEVIVKAPGSDPRDTLCQTGTVGVRGEADVKFWRWLHLSWNQRKWVR